MATTPIKSRGAQAPATASGLLGPRSFYGVVAMEVTDGTHRGSKKQNAWRRDPGGDPSQSESLNLPEPQFPHV